MKEFSIKNEAPKEKGILINGINYSYLIKKSENDKESLIIKLFDLKMQSNIYFIYEADIIKLIKDFKFLVMCESLDEMVNSLKEVFSQANPKVEEKNGEFFMEFEASGFGIKKKFIIKLIKHEIEKPKEINNELYSNNMNLNNMNFMGMNYNMNMGFENYGFGLNTMGMSNIGINNIGMNNLRLNWNNAGFGNNINILSNKNGIDQNRRYYQVKFIFYGDERFPLGVDFNVQGRSDMTFQQLIKNFRIKFSDDSIIIRDYELDGKLLDPNSQETLDQMGINNHSVIKATKQ